MIIKASQRGNARDLANHLMNARDNDRITVHHVDGFVGDDVHSAFVEVEAISRGTKCVQPLFSVSFNPPKGQSASIADFESAIQEAAKRNNLENQPHVIVFHEKHGRRHAHAVWSRIDAESMTAINLPYYKNRLNTLSKELYLEHGWELPEGHKNKNLRNPLNFTLAQWQQAKRLNEDPKAIKYALMECWQTSDGKQAFETALDQNGFALARGDRRGFVAVDWRGEVFSLSKWAGVKSKELKARLGDAKELLSVQDIQKTLDQKLRAKVQDFLDQAHTRYQARLKPHTQRKVQMNLRHDQEREQLGAQQKQREDQLLQEQQARFHRGMRGLWDRMIGKSRKIAEQNAFEHYTLKQHQQKERDAHIHRQLEQRRMLQNHFDELEQHYQDERNQIKDTVFNNLSEDRINALQETFDQDIRQAHEHRYTMEL